MLTWMRRQYCSLTPELFKALGVVAVCFQVGELASCLIAFPVCSYMLGFSSDTFC